MRWGVRDEARWATNETGNGADLIACQLIPRPGAGDYLRPADEGEMA